MASFFKIFFASLLALLVFALLFVLTVFGVASSVASKSKPEIARKSILVLDLSQGFPEQKKEADPVSALASGEASPPGLFDVVRLIEHARTDEKISGIFIKANGVMKK